MIHISNTLNMSLSTGRIVPNFTVILGSGMVSILVLFFVGWAMFARAVQGELRLSF